MNRASVSICAALIGLVSIAMSGPAAALQRADPGGGAINLVCYGEGERPTTNVRSGYEWDHRDHRYRPHNYVESGTDQFDTFVTIQIFGNQGRIRPSRKLVPPIHSGGSNGWWDLEDVDVSRDRIRARYRLNGLNRPRVSIDRISGQISIDGMSDFEGRCDPVDSGARRF